MKLLQFLSVLLFSFFLISCNEDYKLKKEELRKKEISLNKREKAFAEKEAEYQSLIKMRDSLIAEKDTTTTDKLSENITGKWNVKMICTASSCAGYAIGDQKNEMWEISGTSNNINAKVFDKGTYLRNYSGRISNDEIILDHETKDGIIMKITITGINSGKIKGSRDITGKNDCKAMYDLDFERAQ